MNGQYISKFWTIDVLTTRVTIKIIFLVFLSFHKNYMIFKNFVFQISEELVKIKEKTHKFCESRTFCPCHLLLNSYHLEKLLVYNRIIFFNFEKLHKLNALYVSLDFPGLGPMGKN